MNTDVSFHLKQSLKIGQIYTNQEITDIFEANPQRGMKKSNKYNSLALLSDHTKKHYQDYLDKEQNTFYYTGMGLIGDQELTYENGTLDKSRENGVSVHLFEAFSKNQYIYLGEVELAGKTIETEGLDIKGNLRKIYVFPLFLKETPIIPASTIDAFQKNEEKKARKKGNRELRERALDASKHKKPSYHNTSAPKFERDEFVKEYTLRRAKGKCELCHKSTDYMVDGRYYLESHHIVWLSRNGADSVDNTAAVCPNCHRKLHLLDRKSDITELRATVAKDELVFRKEIDKLDD